MSRARVATSIIEHGADRPNAERECVGGRNDRSAQGQKRSNCTQEVLPASEVGSVWARETGGDCVQTTAMKTGGRVRPHWKIGVVTMSAPPMTNASEGSCRHELRNWWIGSDRKHQPAPKKRVPGTRMASHDKHGVAQRSPRRGKEMGEKRR